MNDPTFITIIFVDYKDRFYFNHVTYLKNNIIRHKSDFWSYKSANFGMSACSFIFNAFYKQVRPPEIIKLFNWFENAYISLKIEWLQYQISCAYNIHVSSM